MRARRQYTLFFLLVVAVVAGGFWMARRPRRDVPEALSAVPRDAWLVLAADAAALRASPVAAPLLGAGGRTVVPGLGPLADACGFDPVARLRDLVVCAPEGGERGDFGVAFTGDFTREELSRCADRVIRARAGNPVASTREGYAVLEDVADPAHARFAYRDGGPFLVGRGAWLDAMIDAASGKGERARTTHAALREALAPRGGEGPPALELTAVLPAAVRQKLRAELGSEIGTEGERAYAAVLAVEAAGLSVGPGAGGTTELHVEVRCETADACTQVKGLVERRRLSFSRDLGLRLVGLGPLLDSLSVDAQGASLSVRSRAPSDELARALQRLVDSRTRRPPPAASTPQSSAPPAPSGS